MKFTLLLLSLLLCPPLLSCAAPPAGNAGTSDASAGLIAAAPETAGGEETEGEDAHSPALEDNILPHEPGGYCGNTVTTLRYTGGVAGPAEGSEAWERSFWGSPSVELTDLLLYLDYSGDVCRCLPEYEVDTEFSDTAYGINLTSAYARHDGKQVSLTQTQVEQIQAIIDQITAESFDTLAE